MAEAKPLRVLIVGIGGPKVTFLDRLVQGLASAGVQVTLAMSRKPSKKVSESRNIHWLWTPSWDKSVVSRIVILIILILRYFPIRRFRWLFQKVKTQRSISGKVQKLYQLLPFSRSNCDVIYFVWNGTAIDYKELFDLGIPTVVSCRGSQIYIRPYISEPSLFAENLEWTLRNATAVHGVSDDVLSKAEKFGLDRRKAHVIYPAVDPEFFYPIQNKPIKTQLIILMVGSLVWVKGYKYALMAAEALKNFGINFELHIIGKGPDRNEIQFYIQDLGLQKYVILHGQLSPVEVRDHLQKADIFLHTAISEAFCNAVMEAQATGIPVVSTDANGLKENVVDGVTGFLVPIRDPLALAERLLLLANNVELRARMGSAGRERIIKYFSQNEQINSFIDFFLKYAVKNDS